MDLPEFYNDYGVAFMLHQTIENPITVSGSYGKREISGITNSFIIPDPKSKICRFCGKSDSEVTFRKKAHSIPEFLGNKIILSNNECDTCNEQRFSLYEDHLAKYLQPFNVLTGVVGKKGIPKYKSRDKLSSIAHKNNRIEIRQCIDGEKIAEMNQTEKSITLKELRQPYIPSLVYKGILKIALSLLPSDVLKSFNIAKHILMSEELAIYKPASIIERFYAGPNPFKQLTVAGFLRTRATNNLPCYIFMLCYRNFSLQIFVPCDTEFDNAVVFPPAPTPFDFEIDERYKARWDKDLSGIDKISNDYVNINLTFDNCFPVSVDELELL